MESDLKEENRKLKELIRAAMRIADVAYPSVCMDRLEKWADRAHAELREME